MRSGICVQKLIPLVEIGCVNNTIMSEHRKKTVLHVISGLGDGGAESVLCRLCLNSHNFRHVVVSMTDSGKYAPLLTANGIDVYCLSMPRGRISLKGFFLLFTIIREVCPDVVQTWMYHADLLGGVAARIVGVKRVFWGVRMSSLGPGVASLPTRWVAKVCAWLSRWIPHRIICCAEKASLVHAELGYQSSKIIVIPNGYDLSRFLPDLKARSDSRKKMGVNSEDFLIGNVARFDPLKDHLNLLKAFALTIEHAPNIHCALVGKDVLDNNKFLASHISKLGLSDHVLLMGPREDIPEFMNALDLHVLSSRSEGFPNVVAESMACGTPCVSTDVGDSMEIVGDESLCCAPQDPVGLSDLILKMFHEKTCCPDKWQARRAASRQRISARFSIDGMVQAYEKIWLIDIES